MTMSNGIAIPTAAKTMWNASEYAIWPRANRTSADTDARMPLS